MTVGELKELLAAYHDDMEVDVVNQDMAPNDTTDWFSILAVTRTPGRCATIVVGHRELASS